MNYRETLKNAKTGLADLRDYAVYGIKAVCDAYGPRPCGEESDIKAQYYMLDSIKKYSDEAWRECFRVNPDAFMSFVPLAGTCMFGATAANILAATKCKKSALGSLGLIGTALSGIVGEFLLYKKPLDPFFKEKEGGNVIAVRKASGETKRRIILSGHTDSAPEWTYTYKFGSNGSYVLLIPAITGLLYTGATAVVNLTSKNKKLKKAMSLGQLAFTPAYAGLFNFTNSKRYVDGANDDLSGCYVSSAVMKYLSDNDIRFENTEVICLLAGGEECGLRGSKAFFEAHPEYKKDDVETIFIGFDTIRDEDYMMIYERDMTGMVKNDKRVCDLLKKAAEKCGKDVPIGAIPLGSTDAAAASQAGIAAASFVAMDPAPADYYHTRRDTADILVPETIEKVIDIALQTVFDFDEKGV